MVGHVIVRKMNDRKQRWRRETDQNTRVGVKDEGMERGREWRGGGNGGGEGMERGREWKGEGNGEGEGMERGGNGKGREWRG